MTLRVFGNLGAPVASITNPPTATVRTSATLTGTSSTTSATFSNYGALGLMLFIDQSVVAATSAGGQTGVLTHTLQVGGPLSGLFASATGTVVQTTGISTWAVMYYPGSAVLAPTSGNVGTYPLAIPTNYRVSSVGSSSATTWTFSIAAVPLPTSASSS